METIKTNELEELCDHLAADIQKYFEDWYTQIFGDIFESK